MAAAELGVGLTAFKRLCRERFGIQRWPQRKRACLQRLIAAVPQYAEDKEVRRTALSACGSCRLACAWHAAAAAGSTACGALAT